MISGLITVEISRGIPEEIPNETSEKSPGVILGGMVRRIHEEIYQGISEKFK